MRPDEVAVTALVESTDHGRFLPLCLRPSKRATGFLRWPIPFGQVLKLKKESQRLAAERDDN